MNLFLNMLQWHFPLFLKKQKLAVLWEVTADAFQCAAPPTRGLSFEQSLSAYALFTKKQAERYLQSLIDIDQLKVRLYNGAYQLGQQFREQFKITTTQEVMLMMKIVYSVLEMDMQIASSDEILIERCFFSRYYSPQICQLISALDEGLAAGLSDGGKLGFYERITEGHNCCRAKFALREA